MSEFAFKSHRPYLPVVFLGALALAGTLWGCRAAPDPALATSTYPSAKKQTETLNVQVARENTSIVLTNTTARRLPTCTMWLNASFAREIGDLPVGESARYELSEFCNEFGERFRAGGFFAIEPPDLLVLAQLEYEDHMAGLIVVQGKGN